MPMADPEFDSAEPETPPGLRRSSEHWTLLGFSIAGLLVMLGFAVFLTCIKYAGTIVLLLR